MGRVLVIVPDRVFAALVEDRLRGAGLEVQAVDDVPRALEAVARRRPSAIVVDLDLPVVGGVELIRALGEQFPGGTPPIVALSEPLPGPERVEVLRAGASELLFRPVDLDELTIRVSRLSQTGDGAGGMALEGRLDATPFWELLQFLEQAQKSGQLLVWDRDGSGRLRLAGGRVVGAEWETLRGHPALLAMLGLRRGRFRVVESAGLPGPADGEPLPVRQAMMEAAWIEDELAKRRDHLPSTGTPLARTGAELPDPGDEFPDLPIHRVADFLEALPGSRLYDLLLQGWTAPQKVRLAVAWLSEHGGVEASSAALEPDEKFPSTMEIAVSEVLDLAAEELVSVARRRGFDGSPHHYLLLAEPGRWPALERLARELPRTWKPEAVDELHRRLEVRGSGSIHVDAGAGELALHFHTLVGGEPRARIEAIVPVCAGVLVWLERVADAPALWGIVQRLEKGGRARGLLIAADPTVRERIADRAAALERWSVAAHEPESLLGVLRMLGAQEQDAPAPRRSGR